MIPYEMYLEDTEGLIPLKRECTGLVVVEDHLINGMYVRYSWLRGAEDSGVSRFVMDVIDQQTCDEDFQ